MITHRTVVVRNILVAVDFSALSIQALEAAAALAEHFGATLHIFHAVSATSERVVTAAKISSLASEFAGGVEAVTSVSTGHAATAIVRYAEKKNIDLIVLGTHGRSDLARIFTGSVAEAVLRTAPCQVLTIGPKAHAGGEDTMAGAAVQPDVQQSRCRVCAKPSEVIICDSCKAHIQGEAIERKRREEQAGHLGFTL